MNSYKQLIMITLIMGTTLTCSILNCDTCKANGQTCAHCRVNYWLTSEETCRKNSIENCVIQKSSKNCSVCRNGYYVNQGICSPQQNSRCLSFIPNTNYCLESKSKLFSRRKLQSSTNNQSTNCSPTGQDSNGNTCFTCLINNSYPYVICLPASSGTTIQNCNTYASGNTQCKVCKNLYYLSSPTTCTSITAQSCQQSDGVHNACQLCTFPLIVSPLGTCISQNTGGSTPPANQFPANCQYYISQLNLCQTCINLYYLSSQNVCSPINDQSGFCKTSDGIHNACAVCIPPYVLSLQGTCIFGTVGATPPASNQVPANCQYYILELNLCQVCSNLFYLTLPTTCTPIADQSGFCQLSDGVHNACTVCITPYTLNSSGICARS